MSRGDDQAYPFEYTMAHNVEVEGGMTIREVFAKDMASGMLAEGGYINEGICAEAVVKADALLAELGKKD